MMQNSQKRSMLDGEEIFVIHMIQGLVFMAFQDAYKFMVKVNLEKNQERLLY